MGRTALHGQSRRTGFKLFKPWGDSAPYDVAIELKGRFARIQVKSTMCKVRARGPRSRRGAYVANMRHIAIRPYQESDFDFAAVYIIPLDLWYILPSSIIARRSAIQVFPGRKKNRYEQYREAWHFLRDPKDATSKSACGITLHAVEQWATTPSLSVAILDGVEVEAAGAPR